MNKIILIGRLTRDVEMRYGTNTMNDAARSGKPNSITNEENSPKRENPRQVNPGQAKPEQGEPGQGNPAQLNTNSLKYETR